jgi:single-strand DNA-binding protein
MNPEITLVGRLGMEPEKIGNGQQGIRLRMVTSDRIKNQAGEWIDKDTSWWTVKLWGRTAEQAFKTLKKGQEVMVRGTIFQDSWTDKDGSTKTTYEIRGESIGVTSYSLSKNSTAAMAAASTEDPWK